MDDVFKMHAMSDGDQFEEPDELDSDQGDDFLDEEEDLGGSSGIHTTSMPWSPWKPRSRPKSC